MNVKSNFNIYNLGLGVGISVLELIYIFERVNGIKIFYDIVERRLGDFVIVYVDVFKVKIEFNWEIKLIVEDMVKDVWVFEKNLR